MNIRESSPYSIAIVSRLFEILIFFPGSFSVSNFFKVSRRQFSSTWEFIMLLQFRELRVICAILSGWKFAFPPCFANRLPFYLCLFQASWLSKETFAFRKHHGVVGGSAQAVKVKFKEETMKALKESLDYHEKTGLLFDI